MTLTKEVLERNLSEQLLQTFNELIRLNNTKKTNTQLIIIKNANKI